jgi:RHS repeat-associated protein
MGNITKASGTLNPATPDRGYFYDPLYRLTTAQTGAVPPSPLEAYTYDKTGDRLSAALNGGAAQTYAYTPLTHHLASVGGTARTYDLNGNTQTGTATGLTLGYDARNRLSTAMKGTTTSSYGYNGRGERVSKSIQIGGIGGSPTLYAYNESGQLLGEYTSATIVQAEYVYLDSTPIAVVKAGVPYYIEADHLGTPRQVIDKTRNVAVWKWDSLASTFGTNAPNQDPDGDAVQFVMNLRFPGQYFDTETSLSYNRARDYDPSTGRYIESDPFGQLGGIDTYSYVDSRPLFFVDPSGLAPKLPPTGDCKETELKSCAAACAETGRKMAGCYVSISWKIKGVRNGNPIYSEQRRVNCRCEDGFCENNPNVCRVGRNTGVAILGSIIFVWACLETADSTLNVL